MREVAPSSLVALKPLGFSKKTIELITCFICSHCDVQSEKLVEISEKFARSKSYNHAMKLRAAIAYHYSWDLALGSQAWQEHANGTCTGNPSLSQNITRYMKGLQRDKIRAGYSAESARAITSHELARLYEVNQIDPAITGQEFANLTQKDPLRYWGGYKMRKMLQAIYLLAFICLLRAEEVLRIQVEHLRLLDPVKGVVQLTLPFRKTHQHGGELYEKNVDGFDGVV